MVAEACGGELRLSGPAPQDLIVQVHAATNGIGDSRYMIIKILEPNRAGEPPTPARLRDWLGVTRRQSELIAELAGGASEPAAARRLG